MTTVRVLYSCNTCGLVRVHLDAEARGEEGVLEWMEQLMMQLARDHRRRSPTCPGESLQDLLIPVTGTDRIGGPVLQ